jgi:integrase/recombinase XerD
MIDEWNFAILFNSFKDTDCMYIVCTKTKMICMIYLRIVLDSRRKQANGIYPVKLRITYNRVQKYYLTGYTLTKLEFVECMRNPPVKKLQNTRIQLDHIEFKARTIISNLDGFSFISFEDKFFENKKAGETIFQLYETVIDAKLKDDKIGTASNYTCSMNSLQKYSPNLSFLDVTPEFLKSYEKNLLSEGKSISTVGIYLRPLRAILNESISQKLLPANKYPFGKRKYIIPASRNIKKALSRQDLKKIIDYTPDAKNIYECRSKDFWLLSYLCQGMNPKDILLLKKIDLEGDFIKFIRQKTKDTTRSNLVEIIVPLLNESKEIIKRWKDEEQTSPYLFNFIKPEMTSIEKHKTVQQFVKVTNKHMGKIAIKVGIGKRCTCYSARYGFTQAMIEADVSIEYIRQCLGHQNPTTTLRYISSFESSKRMAIATKHLLNFNT